MINKINILLNGFFLANTGFLKSVFSTSGFRVTFGEGSNISFKKFPISSYKKKEKKN